MIRASGLSSTHSPIIHWSCLSCCSGVGVSSGRSRAGRQPFAVLSGVGHRIGTALGRLVGPMGHGRYALLDGHIGREESNRPDNQINVRLGMFLEVAGEDPLDPFTALGGLAFFIDDLSPRQESDAIALASPAL